jgi:hypothetical protein
MARSFHAPTVLLAAALSCASAKLAAEPPPQPPVTREVAATDKPAKRKGSLRKEDIRRAINRNINAVRACFESAVVRNPDCERKIVVRFKINRRGRVASVEQVGQNRADREHTQCVLDAVRAMEFPAPEGDGYVIVTYPFYVHWTGI